MGPFGTTVILPMFPELRDSFDASSSAVGLGFTIYLVPFAALLLVSGTLGERWGRRRTVRGAYLVYAAASVARRAVADAVAVPRRSHRPGCGQRVHHPVAGVGARRDHATRALRPRRRDLLELPGPGRRDGPSRRRHRRRRRLAAGVRRAPRVVALGLAMAPPVGGPRTDVAAPRLGALVNRRMLLLGGAAFAAAAGPIGISVVVGVVARDELGVSGTAAGAILVTGALERHGDRSVVGSPPRPVGSPACRRRRRVGCDRSWWP